MSELAFTQHSRRFSLPENATNWQVMVCENRGVKPVYEDDGTPLIVPITIRRDGLRAAIRNEPGRYKLIALDEELTQVPDVPAAYVTFPPPRRESIPDDAFARDLDLLPAEAARAAHAPGSVELMCSATPATVAVAVPGAWAALPMPSSMSGAKYMMMEAFRTQAQVQMETTRALRAQSDALAAGATQLLQCAVEMVRVQSNAAAAGRRNADLSAGGGPFGPFEPRNAGGAYVLPPVLGQPSAHSSIDMAGEMPEADAADDPTADVLDGPPATPAPAWMGKIIEGLGSIAQTTSSVRDMWAMKQALAGTSSAADSPRNAAPADGATDAPSEEERSAGAAVSPAMLSHLGLVARELGSDGQLLHRLLARLDASERARRIAHLCSLEIDDAAEHAAVWLAPIKVRLARVARGRDAHRAHTGGARGASAPIPSEPQDAPSAVDGTSALDDQAPEASHGDAAAADERDEEEHVETYLPSGGRADLSGASEDEHDLADENVDRIDSSLDDRAFLRSASEPTRPSATKTGPQIAHGAVIQQVASMLTAAEQARVLALAQRMSDQQRAAWIERLGSVPPAQAAALIREQLAKAG